MGVVSHQTVQHDSPSASRTSQDQPGYWVIHSVAPPDSAKWLSESSPADELRCESPLPFVRRTQPQDTSPLATFLPILTPFAANIVGFSPTTGILTVNVRHD